MDSTADRESVHSRLIHAPRERVFRALADPRHLARWWGPEGFSSTFETFEFRPGGRWRFVMHGPDGTDYPNENVLREIVAPERVAAVVGEANEQNLDRLAAEVLGIV